MFPLTPTLRPVLERHQTQTCAIELATDQVIPWLFRLNRRHQDFQSCQGVRTMCRHRQTSLTIEQMASVEDRGSRRSATMVADTFGKVSAKSPAAVGSSAMQFGSE
jgi:hypothetical protein